MTDWRKIKVAFTVAIALSTLAGDGLFSQGRPAAQERRIAVIDGREVVEGEVLVRYRSQTGLVERRRAEYQIDSDSSVAIGRRGARRVRSLALTTQQMLLALRDNPDVEFAEPNYIIRATALPNDPSMGDLWALRNTGQLVEGQAGVPGADISAAGAWDITTGSRATIIGVIDTGIDFSHEDLAANIFTAPRAYSVTIGSTTISCAAGTHGYNAVANTCIPADDNGHGTHVAGIIGAIGNNNVGIAGVNWTANLMPLKVLGADGTGTTADAVNAIEFAIRAKAALGADGNIRILNASWGGANFSQSLSDQIAAANTNDMLFVAAAGSGGTNNDVTPHYPATYGSNNVVSVAAVDNTGALASYSNYGAMSVDLAAPGTAILSTLLNNQYGYLSGTSMAAPLVSGAAALVLSMCPAGTAALKNILLSTADPEPSLAGKSATGGRLNVNAAVRSCLTNLTASIVNGTVSATLTNGPGNATDWVGLFPVGANDSGYVQWMYLNGQRTAPSQGLSNATVQFVTPPDGSYNVRLFPNNQASKFATSNTVDVGAGPKLSINDVTVTEGHSGTTTATFTVTLAPANASQTVTVAYATANGTATAGSDYTAVSGSLSFAPSETTKTIIVPVTGDTVVESNETFTVTLSSPVNALIGDGQGLGTVTNDDGPPPPTISVPASVAPGGTITVSISNGPGNATDWIGLFPSSGNDGSYLTWMYLNGQRTAPATGMTSATITITAPTTPGTYNIRMFANNGTTKIATSPDVAVATQPSLSVNDVTVTEGNSGTTTATFTVTLAPANASQAVTVAYATANGTATAGSDYTAVSGSLSFAPSETTKTISVPVTGDTVAESNETFTLTLSSAVNALIADGQGLGTVTNDDGPPPLTISVPASVAPGGTITVSISNGPGSATDWIGLFPSSGNDGSYLTWMYLNGQRTAPATGMTSATITIAAPTTPGTYNIRMFANNSTTKIATSADITVTGASASPSISVPSSVTRGGTMTVSIANGPGNATDWIGVFPSGGSDTSYLTWMYLNGQRTAPSSGMTNATLQIAAPAAAGTYDIRMFANNGSTKIATSATFTVSP